jgi:hypothetical protein
MQRELINQNACKSLRLAQSMDPAEQQQQQQQQQQQAPVLAGDDTRGAELAAAVSPSSGGGRGTRSDWFVLALSGVLVRRYSGQKASSACPELSA